MDYKTIVFVVVMLLLGVWIGKKFPDQIHTMTGGFL